MTKPMSKMLFYVGIFFLVIFGWYGAKKLIFMWFMSHYQPPAVTISAIEVKKTTWQSYLESVGSLKAINGVDLAAEVPGIVKEIRFNSGEFVKKGDVLITLRDDAEEAALKNNQAQYTLAKLNFDRDQTLLTKNASSQAALDARAAQLAQAEAAVLSVQAQIAQKTLTAPFDGKVGIRQVDIGEYVAPGKYMVTLQALNPLYVEFNLPEQYVNQLALNQRVDVAVNLGKGQTVSGKITAINSKVDQTTRNIQVQATIPNDQLIFYPGMYGSIKVWTNSQQNMIVVPQTAISYSLSGDYVFLLKNESKSKRKTDYHAYRQYVKVGERRGDVVAIQEGLKQGDLIVTSGQLKLQNGTRVIIDQSVEL